QCFYTIFVVKDTSLDILTKKASKQNELLKILGVGFGIAVTLGGTIGTGILRTPGTIAAELGDPVLIMGVWIAVSLYAFLGVLCAIELGVSVPKAGSWYVYAQRAFGDYLGFLTGITSWLGTVASLGFGAYTIAEYLALIFPSLNALIVFIAIAVLIVLTGFHLVGTAVGGRSQEIMSAIKAVGLLVFVVVCFTYGGEITKEAVSGGAIKRLSEGSLLIAIIAALQGIFYTF
ncbi:UNVERIFIED_CONTAM: hypothetical protein GTU68_054241, partial [Idotea baltica]|nr:hypothetical protein [Idotea baltica]